MKKIYFLSFLLLALTSFVNYSKIKITGIVINQNGGPVADAIITISGTDKETHTDKNGKYKLTVSSPEATLCVSGAGFESKCEESHGNNVINFTVVRQGTQTITITGIIRDDKGEPIPGVTIYVSGTRKGTSTNSEGKYVLTNVDPKATICASIINFIPKCINNTGKVNLDFSIKPRENILLD